MKFLNNVLISFYIFGYRQIDTFTTFIYKCHKYLISQGAVKFLIIYFWSHASKHCLQHRTCGFGTVIGFYFVNNCILMW